MLGKRWNKKVLQKSVVAMYVLRGALYYNNGVVC